MSTRTVILLGATGLVGRTMLRLLESADWLTGDPVALASARGAGAASSCWSAPGRDPPGEPGRTGPGSIMPAVLAGQVALPMPEAEIPFVDADDIADVVAKAVVDDTYNGQTNLQFVLSDIQFE